MVRVSYEERRRRRREIAEVVKAGKKIAEVAHEFGVSTALVYTACKEHGVVPVDLRQANRQRRKEVAAAVRAGQKVDVMARQYGISLSSVIHACQEFGVARDKISRAMPKRPKRWSDDQVPIKDTLLKIIAGLIAGKSYTRIGKETGVSKQYVGTVRESAEQAGIFAAVKGLGKEIPEADTGKVTDEEKFRVLGYLLDGRLSRQEIAAKIGRYVGTVTKIARTARKAGLIE